MISTNSSDEIVIELTPEEQQIALDIANIRYQAHAGRQSKRITADPKYEDFRGATGEVATCKWARYNGLPVTVDMTARPYGDNQADFIAFNKTIDVKTHMKKGHILVKVKEMPCADIIIQAQFISPSIVHLVGWARREMMTGPNTFIKDWSIGEDSHSLKLEHAYKMSQFFGHE